MGTGCLGRPQIKVAYINSRKIMLPMYKYK